MGNWYDDEDENTETSTGPKALREALDKAKAELKSLTERAVKAERKLGEKSLTDVLQKKSLNPGLSKWILKDDVDPSDEKAVDKWLEENADIFGFQLNSSDESGAPDEREAELAKMNESQAKALPSDTTFEEIQRRIRAAKDDAEVDAILASPEAQKFF